MELEIALGILSKNVFIVIATMAMMSVAALLTLLVTLIVLKAGRWIVVRIKHEWNKSEASILLERIFKTTEEVLAARLERKGGS